MSTDLSPARCQHSGYCAVTGNPSQEQPLLLPGETGLRWFCWRGFVMKDSKPIVEYGVPIDPRTMIEPPDPDTLELEPGHPGVGDDAYVRRRHALFARCRRHRLAKLGPPLIDYLPDEQRIWRDVSAKLDGLHRDHACSMYLGVKDTLGISAREIPQLRALSERLARETRMRLVPAE